MAKAPPSPGFWRSVRELPGRTPLRVKLMTAVLALVTIALVVISVAGIAILKSSLLSPADSGLRSNITYVAGTTVSRYLSGGGGQESSQGHFVDWIPAGGTVQRLVLPTSQGYQSGDEGPFAKPKFESESVISSNPLWINTHLNKPFTLTSASGGVKWRVLMENVQVPPEGASGTVVLAVDVTSVYTTIGKLATIDLLVSLAVIVLIAMLGIGLIRASLRALTDVEKTAGAIAAGDLGRRVPERDPRTEMGRLGRSLNAMLSQIEAAFQSRSRSEAAAKRSEERMRQFVADASHELRTPLTAIRGFAEYYRQRGGIAVGGAAPVTSTTSGETGAVVAANGDRVGRAGPLAPSDMDRIMRRVEQESARMGILVEDMLLLARIDQQRPLTASPVDLLTLAADAVHDARVVAPSRSINLTVSSGRALLVIGDEVRLRQVIGNLMSNALTHTPDGTPIDVLIRSGNLDEAAAGTAVARPDVARPSPEDEPAAGNRLATDNGHLADNAAAGEDDWATASNGPATGNGRHPDGGHAADNPPPTGNWATTDGDTHWDADHVPPPPGPPAPNSPTGRVPARLAPAGPAAVLEVADHGPGLTREQAEHVFERFYRADPARTTGGTGLGLAIVAALIAAHGGTAWVRSRPGEGATFCIALPLAPEAMHGADNDFDGDADDITAETGTIETGASEYRRAETGAGDGTGPAEPGLAKPTDDHGEARSGQAPPAEPGTSYTRSAGAELSG